MRALVLSPGRCLTLFLALQLADVPILCPEAQGASSTEMASPFSATASIQPPDGARNPGQNETVCACPCHSVFQAARQPDLLDARIWIRFLIASAARPLSERDGKLDHPPQNFL